MENRMSAFDKSNTTNSQAMKYYAVFHSPRSWTVQPKSEEEYRLCVANRYSGTSVDFREPAGIGDKDIFLNDLHAGWLFLCQEEQKMFLRLHGFLKRTDKVYTYRE